MRYARGGGLSVRARAGREALRLEAAGLLAAGMATDQVAARLRVTPRSVRRLDGGADTPRRPGLSLCRGRLTARTMIATMIALSA